MGRVAQAERCAWPPGLPGCWPGKAPPSFPAGGCSDLGLSLETLAWKFKTTPSFIINRQKPTHQAQKPTPVEERHGCHFVQHLPSKSLQNILVYTVLKLAPSWRQPTLAYLRGSDRMKTSFLWCQSLGRTYIFSPPEGTTGRSHRANAATNSPSAALQPKRRSKAEPQPQKVSLERLDHFTVAEAAQVGQERMEIGNRREESC